MANQLVTAVIPAFNAERFLPEAIESVLAQTHREVECIVVDDGSTDSTADVAASFEPRVRVVRQGHAGVSTARNRGVAEGSGELLAFLDADDVWLPERLERQLAVLRATGTDAVLCAATIVGQPSPLGAHLRLVPGDATAETLMTWRGTIASPGSNLLIERSAFVRLGGFEETLGTVSDWELLVRLLLRGRLEYIDEALVRYRWHEHNLTRDVVGTEADLRRAYELILTRDGDHLSISRRRAWSGFHRMLAGANLSLGRDRAACAHLARAVWCDPRLTPELARAAVRRLRSR